MSWDTLEPALKANDRVALDAALAAGDPLNEPGEEALICAVRYAVDTALVPVVWHAGARPPANNEDEVWSEALGRSQGAVEMVATLQNLGLTPSPRVLANYFQSTLTHSTGPWVDVARLMLRLGADVNARIDSSGNWNPDWTPLLVAIWRCDPALVELLLEAGADISLESLNASHPYNNGESGPRIPKGKKPLAVARAVVDGMWGRHNENAKRVLELLEAATPAAPKKPGAKKPDAKKPGAKKPAAKKPDAKKPDAKKPVAKKPVAKKKTQAAHRR